VQNSIKELLNRGERRKSRNAEWCDSARCSVKGCTNLGDLVRADSIRSLRNMSIGSTVYKLRLANREKRSEIIGFTLRAVIVNAV
jgi:hypothetical protein